MADAKAIEITPEMIAAGLDEYFDYRDGDDPSRVVCDVFQAMLDARVRPRHRRLSELEYQRMLKVSMEADARRALNPEFHQLRILDIWKAVYRQAPLSPKGRPDESLGQKAPLAHGAGKKSRGEDTDG